MKENYNSSSLIPSLLFDVSNHISSAFVFLYKLKYISCNLKLWVLNRISSNSWSGALTESHWCQSQKSIFLTFGHNDFLRVDCPYFCLCGCHYSPFLPSHNCQSIKLVPEQLSNAMQHSGFNHNGQFHEKSTCGEISIFVPKTVFNGTS